jgi:pimeloyl-ACP methyl ester carboxylesterase
VTAEVDARGRTMAVAGGRTVGYADWGDPDGFPVVHLHGTPGSRLSFDYADESARRLGARVIATDRPGIGLSSTRPDYTMFDVADDVAALADALGIDRFAVVGWSGGGPYALACPARLGDRVSAVAMVAPAGPLDTRAARRAMTTLDRIGWLLSVWAPVVGAPLLGFGMRWSLRHPASATKSFAKELPQTERDLLAALPAGVVGPVIGSAEAGRTGGRGIVDDYRALGRPWPFRPADIHVPVHFWHGDDDRYVPLSVSQTLSTEIPDARLTIVPGSGHLIAVSHVEQILTDLLPPP